LEQDRFSLALPEAHLFIFRATIQTLVARRSRAQSALEAEPGAVVEFFLMRGALRFLICLVISCSLALAAIPAQAPVAQIEKASCCAKMKTKSATNGCDRPAPKSDQEKQCCAACAFGCALFVASATPFIYPPVGEETFAAFLSREHTRSQPPPVPPPRA
jgi:hypothetical protein